MQVVSNTPLIGEDDADIVAKHIKSNLIPNKYYILKNESRSVLAHLDQEMQYFEKIDKQNVYGIMPRNAEQTFATHALCNENILRSFLCIFLLIRTLV